MNNSKVDVILRLEFMIKHWDEIAQTPTGLDKLPRGVNPFQGICLSTQYFFHRQSLEFAEASDTFVSAVCPGKGRRLYPVGGPEEYDHIGKNLFTNPDRKLYAHWIRDNIEWSLNPFQRLALKCKRPFYKNRKLIWNL